jgi:spore coat polysaccharide biosynthesis protein SpsF (cytidylyltransferase family)
MTRTVAIIQARMGSTRVREKVLLSLLGEPLLAHVVRRVSRARSVDATVVATTVLPADDEIVDLGRRQRWSRARARRTSSIATSTGRERTTPNAWSKLSRTAR